MFVHITKTPDASLQESLNNALKKIQRYMANNRLQLNPGKTQLMVLSRNPARRKEIFIPSHPKNITHSTKIKILGVEIEQSLSWRYFLVDGPHSIARQLKTRVSSIKLLSKSASTPQLKMVANGIVMSKFEYGAEVWANAPNYIIKILQSIQLDAARSILGPHTRRWSTTHLLKELNWLSVAQIGLLASVKLTHKVLTLAQPAILAHRILTAVNHTRHTRANGPFQVGPPPPGLGRTQISKYQYRPNLYRHYQDRRDYF